VIYVSNFNSDSVSVFEANAHGNAAPVRRIAGPRTRLRGPIGIAVDAERNLYVANRGGTGVTVYPPDADGDVAPWRVLSSAGMQAAEALAVGPTGAAFVSSWPSDDGSRGAAIYHFGNATEQSDYAIAGSRTGLTYPVGLAIDEQDALLVANAFGGVVSAFAAGATGNALPLRSFTAATCSTQGIAYGARMLLLSDGCVWLYSGGVAAGATPSAVFARSALLPWRRPAGVAIDVGVAPPLVCVTDFAASAVYLIRTAGVAPQLRVESVSSIDGPATRLDGPIGVLVAGCATTTTRSG